ncbi:MAG TPA: class III extradiol dioxygenase subunit B-like domain-containing protein, partial [Candidatus Limiplasma sp.]|nr:class III extradiol dioxygenase subunit B-like domain-containing protein [Candidatus Limiplasma sp.]
MPVVAAYAVPHPPILLPEIGRGEEQKIQKTARAYAEVMRRVAAHQPDVLIVTSPHTTLYADYFHVSPGRGAEGSMARFRAPELSVRADYDAELVQQIALQAEKQGISAGTQGERDRSLDHGTLIPLLFLQKTGFRCPIVRVGLSGLSTAAHYQFGQCIAHAVDALHRKAVFIASGDLSHKLTADGPYGYAEQGPVFDKALTAAFASGRFDDLLAISPLLAADAAECGWRSFQIMAGALDQKSVSAELLSYEGPFGVGYGVAAFEVAGEDCGRNYGQLFEQAQENQLREIRAREDAYVRLARQSAEKF